mgnify:CR=1 FL=1
MLFRSLVLSFVKAAPTAASLAWFRSTLLGPDQIAIEWQTLVEVQVIGFYLERSADEAAWQRVAPALVPAAAQDARPQVYRVMDIVEPAVDLRYRLVEVDLRGQERIVAESALMWPVEMRISRSDRSLVLHLASPSSGTAVIEVAENPVFGPWTQFLRVALSDAGPASVRLGSPPGSSTRFYRARLESPRRGVEPGGAMRATVDSDSHEGGTGTAQKRQRSLLRQAHCHRFDRASDACCGDLSVTYPLLNSTPPNNKHHE